TAPSSDSGLLTLRPQCVKPSSRKAHHALVHEIARLPAREELRVEAVQTLDLEVAVGDEEPPARQALEAAARSVDEPREGGEVERDLLDPALPELLDPARDQELHQAVRRVLLAPHQRERDRAAAVARHEVEEAADPAVGIATEHGEAVAVIVAAELVERHREAALLRALAPAAADGLELCELGVFELCELPE